MYQTVTFQIRQLFILAGNTHTHARAYTYTRPHTFFNTRYTIFQRMLISLIIFHALWYLTHITHTMRSFKTQNNTSKSHSNLAFWIHFQ